MSSERIVNVKDKSQFNELANKSTLTVVHFWAPWATQCEPMDEAMKILAEEESDLKSVNFLRVEAEQLADVSMDYEVIFFLFNIGILFILLCVPGECMRTHPKICFY